MYSRGTATMTKSRLTTSKVCSVLKWPLMRSAIMSSKTFGAVEFSFLESTAGQGRYSLTVTALLRNGERFWGKGDVVPDFIARSRLMRK